MLICFNYQFIKSLNFVLRNYTVYVNLLWNIGICTYYLLFSIQFFWNLKLWINKWEVGSTQLFWLIDIQQLLHLKALINVLTENRKSTSYPADECAILKKKLLSANKILREKLADMSTPHEDNGAYLRASYHTAVS